MRSAVASGGLEVQPHGWVGSGSDPVRQHWKRELGMKKRSRVGLWAPAPGKEVRGRTGRDGGTQGHHPKVPAGSSSEGSHTGTSTEGAEGAQPRPRGTGSVGFLSHKKLSRRWDGCFDFGGRLGGGQEWPSGLG